MQPVGTFSVLVVDGEYSVVIRAPSANGIVDLVQNEIDRLNGVGHLSTPPTINVYLVCGGNSTVTARGSDLCSLLAAVQTRLNDTTTAAQAA